MMSLRPVLLAASLSLGLATGGGAVAQPVTAALKAVLADPEIKKKVTEAGFEIVASDGPALDAYVKSEYDRWSAFIKSSNINLDN